MRLEKIFRGGRDPFQGGGEDFLPPWTFFKGGPPLSPFPLCPSMTAPILTASNVQRYFFVALLFLVVIFFSKMHKNVPIKKVLQMHLEHILI